MTLSYKFPFILGTTADRTGGTWTNLQAGYFFIEDTGGLFWWNGTNWISVPVIKAGPRYTIVNAGTTTGPYYSMKNDGTIFATHASAPDTVIQSTIDQCESEGGGDIYIAGNGVGSTIYQLSGAFAGFTIGNATVGVSPDVKNINVKVAPDAAFKIPNAFTGTFLKFTNGTWNNSWSGGYYYQSTPSFAWVGFELQSDTQAGCVGNRIENVWLNHAAVGIKLTNDGANGFVNGNRFMNCLLYSCNTGVLFNQTVTYVSGQNSMNRNYFDTLLVEHNNRASATYGVKDVIGRANRFLECKIWDILQTASYHTCTITANSEHCIIDGGIITQVGWPADNLSSTTVANDNSTNFYIGKPRTNDNYEDIKVISIPSDPATGYNRLYAKAIDTNSDGLFIKRKINGIITESRIPRVGVAPSASGKKYSVWDGTITSSTTGLTGGLLSGLTAVSGHTDAAVIDSSIGRGRKFTTTTTITTNAGWRLNATFTRREYNPVYRALFRLGTTTLQRLYLGFHTSGVDLTGDDPLNAQTGVMFGCKSGDTNFQILHNDATGVTLFENTGIAIDTNVHRLEIIADDANARFGWSLDSSAFSYTNLTSTEIPGSTTSLLIQNEIQTNEAGVGKILDLALVEVEMDSKW